MPDIPYHVDRIEEELAETGQERLERGEIGWTVETDYMLRLHDEQADTRGARTGDIHRTTDPDADLEYVGTAYYLDLKGDPLDMMDHRYGLWFDIIKGMPRVEVHTDLTLHDPDPLYAAVEDVLNDYDLPVTYPHEDSGSGQTATG